MPYPFMSAYNASKAALTQYSETLRLELEPIGIKVVTVVTGQVSTNLVALPTLEEKSIYKPLEPTLQERAKAHLGRSYLLSAFCTGTPHFVWELTKKYRKGYGRRLLRKCSSEPCHSQLNEALVLERK